MLMLFSCLSIRPSQDRVVSELLTDQYFAIFPEHHEAVLGGPIVSSYRMAQNPSERAETGGHQPTGTNHRLVTL